MPPLATYGRDLSVSYALGLFPAIEALKKKPESVSRVLLHSSLGAGEGARTLLALCEAHRVRTEPADRMLRRLSGKDNCFAAAVFNKEYHQPDPTKNHLVLVNPMDLGNLGTILRTALGLGYRDIALIRPCADPFDPQVVRASMGAILSLHVQEYESYLEYASENGGRSLYPFMLEGSEPLQEAVKKKKLPFSLVFGNEGSGLPGEFALLGSTVRIPQNDEVDSLNLAVAAAIGMYAFREL